MNGHLLFLVWRYVCFHWGKSVILLVSLTLTFTMPLCIKHLVEVFEKTIKSRADSTPLLLGVKGNEYDLTLHTLYFRSGIKDTFAVSAWDAFMKKKRGFAAPFTHGFTARSHPVIGTTLEYFEARQLDVAHGSMFTRLGQCVLGAKVAAKLGLMPGAHLMSDPKNVFNLAGDYPLKMKVAGVLTPSGTPDDEAVFVDLKTHWILEGFGHGHETVETMEVDEGKILGKSDKGVTASAAVIPYLEIGDSNQEDFHFHRSMDELPITAMLIWPHDAKSTALLLGEYNQEQGNLQLIKPLDVVASMMEWVFKVKSFMDANFLLVAFTVTSLAMMILVLSLRLRREEFQTFHCLGCHRTFIVRLMLFEWLLFISMALLISFALTYTSRFWMHRMLSSF